MESLTSIPTGDYIINIRQIAALTAKGRQLEVLGKVFQVDPREVVELKELVRCGKCEYSTIYVDHCWCDYLSRGTQYDDYCAWGRIEK